MTKADALFFVAFFGGLVLGALVVAASMWRQRPESQVEVETQSDSEWSWPERQAA